MKARNESAARALLRRFANNELLCRFGCTVVAARSLAPDTSVSEWSQMP